MFANALSLVSLVLVAATALQVSAFALPSAALAFRHAHRHIKVRDVAVPSTYDQSYLEDYQTYHDRYLQLDCEAKHNTCFFKECCSPLLANQTVSSLPAKCNSANSSSSSVPTSTDVASETPSSTVASETPSSTVASETPSFTVASETPSSTVVSETPSSTVASETSSSTDVSTTSSLSSATSAPTDSVEASSATSTASPPPPSTTTSPATLVSASATSSASSDNDGSALVSGGVATFFYQNGVAGACGAVNPDSALIAAIDQSRYGDSGAVSPLCGEQVIVTNTQNGESVTVTIVDDCPTCENANSIDLSVAAFQAIADLATGEVDVTLQFLNN